MNNIISQHLTTHLAISKLRPLLIFILLIFVFSAKAQIQYSIRLAANSGLTEMKSSGPLSSWKTTNLIGGGIGVSADLFFLKSRFALSTGAWYTIKGVGLELLPNSFAGFYSRAGQPLFFNDGNYYLHYFQLPLALKIFFPNKSATARFYVQGGLIMNLKMGEQALNRDTNYFYQISQQLNDGYDIFLPKDRSWYLGFGREWKLRNNRWLFTCLSYSKGLDSQLAKNTVIGPFDIQLISYAAFNFHSITLEVGMKFSSGRNKTPKE